MLFFVHYHEHPVFFFHIYFFNNITFLPIKKKKNTKDIPVHSYVEYLEGSVLEILDLLRFSTLGIESFNSLMGLLYSNITMGEGADGLFWSQEP